MLMILPTSQLLEIGSMKLPSAIKPSSKTQKFSINPKKNLGSILGTSKSSFVRGLGYSKIDGVFYHQKSVIFRGSKSALISIFFSYKEIHVQQNSLQTHWD